MTTIEIFSTDQCRYCDRAKALMTARGLSYQEYNMTANEAFLDDYRRRLPRSRTVPQIFIDGQHIGGCEDLAALDRDGRLATMTASADENGF